MNRIFFLFLCCFCSTLSNAQIHEIGAIAGGSNYVGEIGSTNYVNPNELSYGIIYKWNKSPRHAWRASFQHSKITANDQKSSNSARIERNYNFENTVNEFSLGFEFNFFEFDMHQLEKQFTPYIHSGLTYLTYDELYFVGGRSNIDQRSKSMAIPMTVGVKTNIATQLILAFEVSTKYTFTDNLDGNNPKNSNLEVLKFGNLNSNDWYVFTGFTLTYTFGNKPCFCNQ